MDKFINRENYSENKDYKELDNKLSYVTFAKILLEVRKWKETINLCQTTLHVIGRKSVTCNSVNSLPTEAENMVNCFLI